MFCYPKEDWKEKPKMKHGFGMDLTMTNCLYDNMMENITKAKICLTGRTIRHIRYCIQIRYPKEIMKMEQHFSMLQRWLQK